MSTLFVCTYYAVGIAFSGMLIQSADLVSDSETITNIFNYSCSEKVKCPDNYFSFSLTESPIFLTC